MSLAIIAVVAAAHLVEAAAPAADAGAAAAPASQEKSLPKVILQDSLVLKVTDRARVADTLIDAAEKLGGYFSARTDEAVVLKVPAASLKKLLDVIEPLGTVVERKHQALDVTFELEQQQTLLASREQVLQRYFAVLTGAAAESVVTVEREMVGLIEEIEQLRGQIQLTSHRLAFAEVNVSFQFRERQPPARDGSSSFPWLNTMNLVDLVGEFVHEN